MVLYTTQGSENIPTGYIKLGQQEAIDYQWKVVNNWEKLHEVFFIRYGKLFATAGSLVSSYITVSHFHNYFKNSKKYLILSSTIPTLFGIGASFYCFDRVVTNNILIMKDKCAVCTQVKFTLYQVVISLLYPAFIGAQSSFMIANKNKAKPIAEGKDVFSLWLKILKLGGTKFQLLTASHFLTTIFISYMQHHELSNIYELLEKQKTSET